MNRYNGEGYLDMTAYLALSRIEREEKRRHNDNQTRTRTRTRHFLAERPDVDVKHRGGRVRVLVWRAPT